MTSVMDRNDADTSRTRGRATNAAATAPATSRRLLPSSRALVGSLLVVIAAAGVLAAHRGATSSPTTRYVVATRDIPAGTQISTGDLGSVAIDLPSNVGAYAVTDADDVVGTIARHDIAEMDLLRPADLSDPATTPDAASVIVPVEVESARALADSVHPGSRVHVLATDPDGAGTVVLATDVLVVAVGEDDQQGIGVSGTEVFRLALPDSQVATAVVDASVRQQLTLVVPEGGADHG